MSAVFRHELRGNFHSLTTYLFGACLLAFIGLWAMMYNLRASVSNFEFVLADSCLAFVVIVPILTMRTVAEERRQKTDQLLHSLPITTVQVVIGKYLALLAVYAVPLCVIAIYPLIFAQFGEVYLPTSYGSLFAFFLLGAALLAVGMFLSSLTENQGFAAGTGIAAILLNYYSVSLSEYVSSSAVGSIAAMYVLILLLALVVKYLTRNEKLAWGGGGLPAGVHPDRLLCGRIRVRGSAARGHGRAVPVRALLRLCERRVRLDGRRLLRLGDRVLPLSHRAVHGETEV